MLWFTTTSAIYDLNTGLMGRSTDENGRDTNYSYNPDSLRIAYVERPDLGRTYYNYADGLIPDVAGRYHYFIMIGTQLDATRFLDSYTFYDGRGAATQTFNNYAYITDLASSNWSTQDIEYDELGRAFRVSNPYYCGGYNWEAINPDGFWTTKAFDRLGRVTNVTMPRGDDDEELTTSVQTAYSAETSDDGIFTTVTDQSDKVRRQKVDALGRVIRLDEPTTTGLGSTGSPNQATTYQYDVLDNLVKITQGSQIRYFKYDSLSRLIRERQVEQIPYSSYDLYDPLTTNSSWTRKIEYNSSSLVTHSYDALGVDTGFYYDDLNRLTQVTYSDSTPPAHYYYDSQTLPSGAPSYSLGYSTGRLIAMTYGSGATGTYFGYDNMGRVVTQKQVTGSTTYGLSYTYNHGGLRTSETYPTNRTLTYSYDGGARLSQISDGTTNFLSSTSFAQAKHEVTETWGNGAVHSVAHNRRLQPTEIKLKQSASGSELQRFDYFYGQVTQSSGSIDTSKNNGQIGKIAGSINGATQWDNRFVYDELGRLKTAAEYKQGYDSQLTLQVQYTFDPWGNRFQSGSGNIGIGYAAVVTSDIETGTNRFINDGSTPTTYDNAGNILTDTKFRGMNYSYDANGRQKTAQYTDGTNTQTSVYDCAGQRVQTTVNGVTRT
ncbi:MAG TPA: hypothetical protein VJ180_10770, partial [Pyrinomonadaceae bacterium]|nr:hypothetical protein [Pyrinomonadaceae bacterium]